MNLTNSKLSFTALTSLVGIASLALGATTALAGPRDSRHSNHQARSGRYNSTQSHHATRSRSAHGPRGHWQARIGFRSPMHRPQTTRRWIPACYKTQTRRVIVCKGRYERRYVPAVYGTRYDACGRAFRVMIKPACYRNVWVPPRYETRQVRVRVPGHYATVAAPHRRAGSFISARVHGRF